MFKRLITGALMAAVSTGATVSVTSAEDVLYVPSLSYRTGPFAGGGIAGLSGGKKSGPPPISGPTPDGDEGLPGIFKRVKKG